MKEYYIYKYLNKNEEIIYIGLTSRPIQRRIKEHEVEELQKETYRIEYAKVKTEADMRMYELYYINKYNPKFNTRDLYVDGNQITLPELNFVPYLETNIEQDIRNTLNERIYSSWVKDGQIDIIVNDAYERRKEKSVSLNINGQPKLKKEELIKVIEQLISGLNDISDNMYEIKAVE